MKIALIGATGNAGARVLNELVSRGHTVTAIVRKPERVGVSESVAARGVDGASVDDLAAAISGHDAVISSARFVDLVPEVLLPAVQQSGVKRYLIVGGAGSLIHPDGIQEADQPTFPEAFRPNSLRGRDLLVALRATDDLDWTYISPSRGFRAGERTGVFRKGKDHMLMTEEGPTWVSYEDMAIAIVDALEQGTHTRERITIGY